MAGSLPGRNQSCRLLRARIETDFEIGLGLILGRLEWTVMA